MKAISLFILFGFVTFLRPFPALAEILHLEIGAANYSGSHHERRFLVLEGTMKDLIAKFGTSGTIYLNDIDPVGLDEAIVFAKTWLQKNNAPDIKVISLYGDFRYLKLPGQMTTIHMTNPGTNQFPSYKQGLEFSYDLALSLGNLAEQSKNGLRITTYFTHKTHEHLPLLEMMLEPSFDLAKTNKKGLPYYYTNGEQVEPNSPIRVYYLVKKRPQDIFNKCSKIFTKPKYAENFEAYHRSHKTIGYW